MQVHAVEACVGRPARRRHERRQRGLDLLLGRLADLATGQLVGHR